MMRLAIPLSDGRFCPHFGRCNQIALQDLDPAARRLDRGRVLDRPRADCESLPGWLASLGVQRVLAGGIGAGALQGLADQGIAVAAGFTGSTTDDVLQAFFDHPEGHAFTPCDHHDHQHQHCRHD